MASKQIEDARIRAYASREARRQQMSTLDFSPIARGALFTAHSLLPTDLTEALRADAMALEAAGGFLPSGLSDTGRTAQGFGFADRLVRALTSDIAGDREARRRFDRHLDALRHAAGTSLGRSLTCAEQYFSIHRTGAHLRRHMDERHEELKGARGWQGLLPRRRSELPPAYTSLPPAPKVLSSILAVPASRGSSI